MAPFYGWGLTASRLEPLRGGSLLFTTKFSEIPSTMYRPWKDERLSQPWCHPVVLNMGPRDSESSDLITSPSLHKTYCYKACIDTELQTDVQHENI